MVTTSFPHEVTELLIAWSNGDENAFGRLIPLIEKELEYLAKARLRWERPNHTLEPAALVNEAYMRLVNERAVEWKNRAHFFAIASERMRQILVDYARRRSRRKRDVILISLSAANHQAVELSSEIIAIDEAIEILAKVAPRQSQIVVFRYFGGLDIEEIAGILKISPRTIEREWKTARAWLYSQLKKKDHDDA